MYVWVLFICIVGFYLLKLSLEFPPRVHGGHWPVAVSPAVRLSGFGMGVVLTLKNEFRSVPSNFFWKSLFRIGLLLPSLNMWPAAFLGGGFEVQIQLI